MSVSLNSNIEIIEKDRKYHSKAAEEYLHVKFKFPKQKKEWEGWVPVEYRRTGVSLKNTDEEFAYLNDIYEQMKPENLEVWKRE